MGFSLAAVPSIATFPVNSPKTLWPLSVWRFPNAPSPWLIWSPSVPANSEILFPLVRINSYEDFEDALTQAKANLLFEGAGHSSSIYSHNDERILHAGMVLPVCRLSVKMPNVMVTGATNSNGMPPTITIGCGTWGGNSGSDNLNYTHLLNKTRIIRRIENAVDKAIDDIFKD